MNRTSTLDRKLYIRKLRVLCRHEFHGHILGRQPLHLFQPLLYEAKVKNIPFPYRKGRAPRHTGTVFTVTDRSQPSCKEIQAQHTVLQILFPQEYAAGGIAFFEKHRIQLIYKLLNGSAVHLPPGLCPMCQKGKLLVRMFHLYGADIKGSSPRQSRRTRMLNCGSTDYRLRRQPPFRTNKRLLPRLLKLFLPYRHGR